MGNNDGERDGILKSFTEIDGEFNGDLGEIEIDGIRFGIYHGTNSKIKANASVAVKNTTY